MALAARDAWSEASSADEHAYRLQHEAQRTPMRTKRTRSLFGRRSSEAADAFEVAADAWEAVDDQAKADIRRNSAAYNRAEAFLATHPHISYGFYLITDAEARKLARANAVALPKPGTFQPVRLGYAGPVVEIHRLNISPQEMWKFQRKRPWVWAILGVR